LKSSEVGDIARIDSGLKRIHELTSPTIQGMKFWSSKTPKNVEVASDRKGKKWKGASITAFIEPKP